MRINSGGPHGQSPYKGPRGSSGGAINMQFRLDWDDTALIKAIDDLGVDGPKAMKNMLRGRIEIGMEEVRKKLKQMAGPLANVTVPPKSKSIHTTIADALKQDDIPGTSFIRVHTATDPKKAHIGRIGTRGVNLSKMMVVGMKPFNYSPFMPQLVKSSAGWFSKTQNAHDYSVAMKKVGRHPGWKRTFDYCLAVENHVRKHFNKDAKVFIEMLAEVKGFYNK
tara:strand:- start:2059 stop:2724 length:666 start_codon:yes stop_codon:yes gene_type:complete